MFYLLSFHSLIIYSSTKKLDVIKSKSNTIESKRDTQNSKATSKRMNKYKTSKRKNTFSHKPPESQTVYDIELECKQDTKESCEFIFDLFHSRSDALAELIIHYKSGMSNSQFLSFWKGVLTRCVLWMIDGKYIQFATARVLSDCEFNEVIKLFYYFDMDIPDDTPRYFKFGFSKNIIFPCTWPQFSQLIGAFSMPGTDRLLAICIWVARCEIAAKDNDFSLDKENSRDADGPTNELTRDQIAERMTHFIDPTDYPKVTEMISEFVICAHALKHVFLRYVVQYEFVNKIIGKHIVNLIRHEEDDKWNKVIYASAECDKSYPFYGVLLKLKRISGTTVRMCFDTETHMFDDVDSSDEPIDLKNKMALTCMVQEAGGIPSETTYIIIHLPMNIEWDIKHKTASLLFETQPKDST